MSLPRLRSSVGGSVCVLLAAACAIAATRPAKSVGVRETKTEHYDLHVENLDANDVGAMLERLHGHLSKFYGLAPKGRLPLGVYATRDRWAAALKADGQGVPDAGGYYAPDNRKAYAWIQPSAYFTRQLVLHEATHQFHRLAATGNQGPSGGWYAEGLAEYFGMHNWDGNRLEVGVVPAITLEDYPAKAMKHLQDANWDLEGMVAGRVARDRPEGWALVHFLANRYPDKFRELTSRLDRREDALGSWRQVFGKTAPRLSGELREWLGKHQQPWRIVWISWQEWGEAIEGDADVNALAVLKQTPKVLEAELEPVRGTVIAGLAFGYASPQEFYLLQVMGGEKYRVERRKAGKWELVQSGALPPAKSRNVLSVEQSEGSVILRANGKDLGTLKAPGQVGLNVDGCKVLFRVRARE